MLKEQVIIKITFDMFFEGVLYKGIELEYEPEETWCLTTSDIQEEDNDSWNMAEVGGNVLDFQIFGNGNGMLSMQANILEFDDHNNCYNHTDMWIYDGFSNVKAYTENKEIILLPVD